MYWLSARLLSIPLRRRWVRSREFSAARPPISPWRRVISRRCAWLASSARIFPRIISTCLPSAASTSTGIKREQGDTFHWRGRYHEDINLRDTIELHLNVLAGFKPKLPESYRDAEYVFLGNIDPVMQMEVVEQIRHMKLLVCDTMDYWIRESNADLKKILQRVEMLVMNDSEARLLSGYDNIVKAARAILRMGPKMVLIKRGEYGVLQFSDSAIFATPAYPLEEVFDPTGAGDSFAGGLMGQLARSGDLSQGGLRRAIVYGSVVASFTVEDFGVKRLTDVSLPEIEERYQRFVELTDFHS